MILDGPVQNFSNTFELPDSLPNRHDLKGDYTMLWTARRTLEIVKEQKRVAEVLYNSLGLSQNNEHVLDYLRYCNDVGEYVTSDQVVSHYVTFHNPQEWKYIDIDDLSDDLQLIEDVYGCSSSDPDVQEYIKFRNELPTNIPLNEVSEHFAMFRIVQEWNVRTTTTQ